jgi:hypothetical protein
MMRWGRPLHVEDALTYLLAVEIVTPAIRADVFVAMALI